MNKQTSNENFEAFLVETLPLIKQASKQVTNFPINPPINDKSEISFSGYNKTKLMLSAMAHGFEDNRWITEKQLAEKYPDLSISQEAVPTKIVHTKKNYFEKDDEGNIQEIPQKEFENRRMQAFRDGEQANAFYNFEHSSYNVYNVSQVPNYPKQDTGIRFTDEDIYEHIENFVASSGVKIRQTDKDLSIYNHEEDVIEMNPSKFQNKEEYYSRLLENYFIATSNKEREDRNIENMNDVFAEAVRSSMFSLLVSSQVGLKSMNEQAEKLADLVEKSSYSSEQLMKASYEANKIMSLFEQYSKGETIQAHWFPEPSHWNELIEEAQSTSPQFEFSQNVKQKPSTSEKDESKQTLHIDKENAEKNSAHLIVYRIYLDVPKEEKDEAKALGAKWDRKEQSWYTSEDNPNNPELFAKWEKPKAKEEAKEENTAKSSEKIYLNVSKEEKEEAKALGAKWDRKAVSWYTTEDNPQNEALFSLYSKKEHTKLDSEAITKARELFSDKDFLKEISSLSDTKKFQAAINTINEALGNSASTQKQSSRQKM